MACRSYIIQNSHHNMQMILFKYIICDEASPKHICIYTRYTCSLVLYVYRYIYGDAAGAKKMRFREIQCALLYTYSLLYTRAYCGHCKYKRILSHVETRVCIRAVAIVQLCLRPHAYLYWM